MVALQIQQDNLFMVRLDRNQIPLAAHLGGILLLFIGDIIPQELIDNFTHCHKADACFGRQNLP